MNPLLTDHIVLVTSVARPAAREGAFAVERAGGEAAAESPDMTPPRQPRLDLAGVWPVHRSRLGRADAVAQARVVFLEAFHNPYHPLFQRSWRSWTPQ